MHKQDWLQLTPSFIAAAVTLAVAFGVWALTSRRENRRDSLIEKRDRANRQQDAYARLYASLYVWPNAARGAFTDPTDRDAVCEYEAAMRDVAVDYGLVLMTCSRAMLETIQVPMNEAMEDFDGLMAQRQASGDVLPVEQAATDARGAQFLAYKMDIIAVRTLLMAQARKDSGEPVVLAPHPPR